jgi:branched-chain amino acid transport system ATP-binding protein
MLELKAIDIRYGLVTAVRDVSMTIGQGELIALLGANGAGKTSVLNAISGVVPLVVGEIIFNGDVITGTGPIGMASKGIIQVPEGRRIFPFLTVLDNLKVGAYLQKDNRIISKNMERVMTLFPVLKEKLNQKGKELSGGQQQMLAVGRALMANPRLLMMDEPSLGLSPLLTQTLAKQIREINKEGTTILLVEQNARMGLTLASRGYVLVNGQVALQGDSTDLVCNDQVKKAYIGG